MEGQAKAAEVTETVADPGQPRGDVRKGFVYERVPHVTLKSIANNPDIREGDPYKRLKTALKADIDEAAWATLYSTRSRPFAKPATGKIAVNVVNHYGDEVLKVYEV